MVDEHRRGSGIELPAFDSRGRLPKGIHKASWAEFVRRFGYNDRRRALLHGLLRALRLLQLAGCRTIYIGGSFASGKQKPRDIDVVWSGAETDWGYLRRIAPVFFEMKPGSPGQKALFGGEFFPAEGIEMESGLTFLEFFQRDRRQRRRGLVQLDITDI